MYQQVNLFQPVFRHEKKVFSALALVQILGLALLVMLAVYGYLRWQLHQLDDNIQVLRDQHARIETQIARLEAEQSGADLTSLEATIDELQMRLATLDQLAARMEEVTATRGGQGFSRTLTGLAQTRLPELWLTRIELGTDGATRLDGRAWNPRLVPRYLARLNQDAATPGGELSQVHISETESAPGQLRFTLSNRPLAELEAGGRAAR